jgi:26S proteasome regulatory subunit (ATPase 3-interacting protein)
MSEGENNKIESKATNGTNKGSQFVFWSKQDPADAASPEELAAMEESIVALREKMPFLKAKVKISVAKLAGLKEAPTLVELAAIIESLEKENGEKKEKLLSG